MPPHDYGFDPEPVAVRAAAALLPHDYGFDNTPILAD